MIKMIRLCDDPQYLEKAAFWFSEKWHIPYEVYLQSMKECIERKNGIPQWYLVLNEQNIIVAGSGIIQNDFHDHPDCTPNLCALYVEKEYRKQNIARNLLEYARKEVAKMGYKKLYLVTDHTSFYERCGYEFLCMVKDDEGNEERMYMTDTE